MIQSNDGTKEKLDLSLNNTEDNLSSETDFIHEETKRVLPIIKQSNPPKNSRKGAKSLHLERNKGLENIRKILSRSVSSGIKTALSRVFRKPPLGSRGSKRSACKAEDQMVMKNKDKIGGKFSAKQQNHIMRPSLSCHGLDEFASLNTKKQGQCHSAEILCKDTKRWIETQQELNDWVENTGEEVADVSSDCDSLFSVDSLSSVYATALAEQLKHENSGLSDAERKVSEMSKDSIIKDSGGKNGTSQSAVKPKNSQSHSLLSSNNVPKNEIEKSKEMPAEVFWSSFGNKAIKGQKGSQVANEIKFDQGLSQTKHSSEASVKETETLFTDAWSSTGGGDKQVIHTSIDCGRFKHPSSLDLSSGVNDFNDNEELSIATLKEQSHAFSKGCHCDSASHSTTLKERSRLLGNCGTQTSLEESETMFNNQMLSTVIPVLSKPVLMNASPVKVECSFIKVADKDLQSSKCPPTNSGISCKEETQSKDSCQVVIEQSRDINAVSNSENAFQPECPKEQHLHPLDLRKDFLYELQSRIELVHNVEKLVTDEKSLHHDQGLDDYLLKDDCTKFVHEIVDCAQLEHESCNGQRTPSRKRSPESNDAGCMKTPKICRKDLLVQSDLLFEKSKGSCNKKDSEKNVPPVETDMLVSSSILQAASVNSSAKMLPVLTDIKKQTFSSHVVNENNISTNKDVLGNSKSHNICITINEAVKEHVDFSFKADGKYADTNITTSSDSINIEYIQHVNGITKEGAQKFICTTNSEVIDHVPKDDNTNGCIRENYVLQNISSKNNSATEFTDSGQETGYLYNQNQNEDEPTTVSRTAIEIKAPVTVTDLGVKSNMTCLDVLNTGDWKVHPQVSRLEHVTKHQCAPIDKPVNQTNSSSRTSVNVNHWESNPPSYTQGNTGLQHEESCVPEIPEEIDCVQISDRCSQDMVDLNASELTIKAATRNSIKASKIKTPNEFLWKMGISDPESILTVQTEKENSFSTHNVNQHLKTNLSESHNQSANQNRAEKNAEENTVAQEHLKSSSIEELNKQTIVFKSSQPLERYCSPEIQRYNRTHVNQRVVSSYSQTKLMLDINEQPNHYTIKTREKEKVHVNQQQSQQLSIITDSEVMNPNSDFSAVCEKFHVNPKYHIRTESTEEANIKVEPNRTENSKHSCQINDDGPRVKLKKYRKSHFTAPPSSTDSTPDSSTDEMAKTRVCRSILAKNGNPAAGTAILVTENKHILSSKQSSSQSSIDSAKDLQSKSLESSFDIPCFGAQGSENVTLNVAQQTNILTQRQCHLTSTPNPSVLSLADETVCSAQISSCKPIFLKEDNLHKISIQSREPVIHFASSDINPFTHTRKVDHLAKASHKHQAFGSDLNIPSPICSDKGIARCYSVDNGLDFQNSPFNSHLSTYAMQKQLSSTLSTSDSKEHIYTQSQTEKPNNTSQRKTFSGSNIDISHNSGLVDKTGPVYSFEHKVQESRQGFFGKCDHETQTVRLEDLKKNNRHQKSITQVPVSAPSLGTSTTCASLQNISEHLSELIHSTSGLLGNIQCMRAEKKCFKYVHQSKTGSIALNGHPGMYGKSTDYARTAIDIGIQTEDAPITLNSYPPAENTKPQEVNLIVKVIGSEVYSTPKQDHGVGSFNSQCDHKQPFQPVRSMPDLNHEGSQRSDLLAQRLNALKLLTLETFQSNQNTFKHKAISCEETEHVDLDSLSNSVRVGASSKSITDMLARENLLQKKTNSRHDKQALFIDRASSPILTVDIPTCLQKQKSNPNNPTETQFSRSVRNRPENKHVLTSQPRQFYTYQSKKDCDIKPSSPVSLKYVTDIQCTDADGSYSSLNTSSSFVKQRTNKKTNECSQNGLLCSTPVNQSNRATMQNYKPRALESKKSWSDRSKATLQDQEEDIMSVVPSECNTDVLVSIDPFSETCPLYEEHGIPENLPMHNKFSDWSGISQHGSANLINKYSQAVGTVERSPNRFQLHSADTESLNECDSHKPKFLEGDHRRTKEIEKLRQDREQVLSSFHLDLPYGLGKTETLIKMLTSSSRVEPAHSIKQQLYERCVLLCFLFE